VIKHPKRMALGAGVLSALLSASVVGGLPASATGTPTTLTIGVGAAPPSGHAIEYTDFFPRTGISLHNGDVVDFTVPSGESTDDLHVVDVLKQGVTATQAMSDPADALVIPDSDEPGSPPLQNVAIFGGTNPPTASGAPGACGDQTTPCSYNGTGDLISGQMSSSPDQGQTDFYVKLALPAGFTGTVNAVDLGHPIKGISAAISVVADSTADSAQASLDQASASQYQSDTSADLAAEASANHDTVSTNANGTHNHTVSVGPATTYTEAMGFFPETLHVAPGDTVTYNYTGVSDPHTVTFPADGEGALAFAVSPFTAPAQCEGPSRDTPGDINTGPPTFGCANPSQAELPILARSMGSSVIRTPAYRLVGANGGIFDFGQAAFHGSAANQKLKSPVVSTASTGDQNGYYEVTANGGVFAYGDAGFFGSLANQHLTAPIVSILSSPDGGGYLLVGADGKTYPFGDVPPIQGSVHVGAPVVGVGVASNPNGPPGFWLATAKGGVFSLEGAPYLGSMGGKHLAAPIVGMVGTTDGGGYWLVGADGGVFAFGDARYLGGMGGKPLASPIVGMTLVPGGNGYWLVSRNGGVFSFGSAVFAGSMGGKKLNGPVVGIDTAFTASSSGILINIPAGNPNALPSRTSFTYTFPDKGTFNYICEFHEMMDGTITVG
jgi:plastocyanin